MTFEVATTLAVGQTLKGKAGSYKLLERFSKHRDVWKAVDENACPVVVKRAHPQLLKRERNILGIVKYHTCIRQLVDEIEDPSSLVLEYLDDNLLDVCSRRRVESADVKFVARVLLEALAVIHKNGYVHTDVKPDNVLVNYGKDGIARFSRVALGDCGDVWPFNPHAKPLEEGHTISAAIFRSPEAQLNLRWGQSTDIWSLGATLISLIFGGHWHICCPATISFDDEHYGFWVFIEQIRRFGPFDYNRFREIADEERMEFVVGAINYIEEHKKWNPFYLSEVKELEPADRDFIAKMMELDPRDRPTARELLDDAYFSSTHEATEAAYSNSSHDASEDGYTNSTREAAKAAS